jgi:hypothetical protein
MDGTCGMHRENRNIYRVLVGKSEGPLGRPMHRWEDNSKMYLNEIGWEVLDWIHPDQDLQFYKMWEISSLAEKLLAFQ